MMNFEKIDDYLANRLPADERKAFEQEISGDPALQEEVAFQQKIVEGVRHARAAELKQMLNNVPVSSGGWSVGRITAGVMVAGAVATALYYINIKEAPINPDKDVPAVIVQPESPDTAPAAAEPEVNVPATEEPTRKSEPAKRKAVTPVQKPDIQVVDPSAELTETAEQTDPSPVSTTMTVSKMEVVTTPASKKYNFHYQFSEGKLMLYGPFDNSLYEILEINGGSHAVFLFYRENYFLLDEGQHEITGLTAIRDGQLLMKLKEYRNR